jgi:hypothetical protein
MKYAHLIVFVALVPACNPSAPQTESDTGAETSTSSTSDPSETGSGFLMPEPDLPPSCDPFLQDCPNGEKCVPYGPSGNTWDANKCVPVLGDHVIGEPCDYAGVMESTDDCDATSFCWNGTCHAFCDGTADTPECLDGTYCDLKGDGVLTLCIPMCDPLAPDCLEGTACYWSNAAFICISPTTDLPPGAACGYINDCAEGNVCLNAEEFPTCEGSACCARWCELGLGDEQCMAVPGTACVPFFEQGEAPAGDEDVGVCILP